jgi:hypothetical protein
MEQFVENLTRVKNEYITWDNKHNERSKALLSSVEAHIEEIMIENPTSSFFDKEETGLNKLMKRRKDLLKEEEVRWRIKSRAIWLK